MNKKLLNIFKFAFFLGLGIFLVWYSIRNVENFDEFKKSLTTARYWMIIPVFLIMTTSHLLRALRWKLLMEPMGYKPSLPNTFFAVMIGYLANSAIPRLGEVLKCTILSKYEDIPAEKNIGTIVAERAFDVLCLLLLFVFALIFQYDVVIAAYQKMQTTHDAQKSSASDIGYYIKIVLLVLTLIFISWIIIKKKWKVFIAKIKNIFIGIGEGIMSALRLKHKYHFIIYSISIWVLYLLGTWLGLYATIGTHLGFGAALSGLAFASLGMVLTPGGIGSYALLLAMILKIYGVNGDIAFANGTLQWFAQFTIVLVVGFICVILLPIYNRKKKNDSIL